MMRQSIVRFSRPLMVRGLASQSGGLHSNHPVAEAHEQMEADWDKGADFKVDGDLLNRLEKQRKKIDKKNPNSQTGGGQSQEGLNTDDKGM
eukprot:TRINITY_DN35039_c0_g1_i1.p1 TRINITY_DN35039_c0_g1~~TRINITY_DN35039_c0_g1_i1.p1  ORF type:complete len:91 (+),score=19.31 TRINITY_DN35039_c0_g1_i1:36-308(+)